MPAWPSHGWLALLALTSQVLGWLLITVSLPRLPAALTSVTLTIQPVASVLLGVILLGEDPSSLQLAGVACILAGLVSIALRRDPARRCPSPCDARGPSGVLVALNKAARNWAFRIRGGGFILSRSRKAILAACAVTLAVVPNAWATHTDKPSPRDRDAKEFVSDVPVSRIVHHQYKLQEIARANGDTRTVLSGGYTDSLEYVKSTLRRAGYNPRTIDFNFPFWRETAPAVLNQVTPTPRTYRYGTAEDDGSRRRRLHHARMTYSPTRSLDQRRRSSRPTTS